MTASVLARAERALAEPVWAITDRAPSRWDGDARCYYSIGNYSWPNPDTVSGLPYVRRDCEHNPDAMGGEYDKRRFRAMVTAVCALAQGYAVSGTIRYAEAATERLERWFLDDRTAMLPTFRHAAALPGVHDGTGIGLIEAVILVGLVDHVELLVGSAPWTDERQRGLRAWFGELLDWMSTSDQGAQASAMRNNHGIWFDAQIMRYADFTGDVACIVAAIRRFPARLDSQVAADGSLPRELARPDTLRYTVFCLAAFGAACRVAARRGHDLWTATSSDGVPLRAGFDFWRRHARPLRRWTWSRLPGDVDRQAEAVARSAAQAYADPDLASWAEELSSLPEPEVPQLALLPAG